MKNNIVLYIIYSRYYIIVIILYRIMAIKYNNCNSVKMGRVQKMLVTCVATSGIINKFKIKQK